jgi:hypothetical protein
VCLENLPESVQDLARKNFDLLKENPRYPSLHWFNQNFHRITNPKTVDIILRQIEGNFQ